MKKKYSNKLQALDKKLKKIKARDIMTEDVIIISKNEDLYKAAEIMLKNRISGIPIVSKAGKVQGIITENDLFMVMDMVKSGDVVLDKKKKDIIPPVDFVMSVGVDTVSRDTTLDEIIILMKYKNQHTIPVMEKGKMAGIIGKHDVFRSFYSAAKSC